jgi:5-methylcytosine-specific restriction endonuclease McrA
MVKTRNKNWFVTHPENTKIHHLTRRARKAEAEGNFTAKEWLDLCERTGNKCLCCGSTGKLTADHIVPLAKGGSNFISNIQPLCGSCNDHKGTHNWRYIDF